MNAYGRSSVLGVCLMLGALAAPTAHAETVYVADRFEIGVHENTNLDSVILAVIASGTPLTVIRRDGEFAEITTPAGIKGWVDTRYLISEKPSVALLDEREAKIEEAMRSLGAARAEVEVLRQRVSELQRDAATATHGPTDIAKPIALVDKESAARVEQTERAMEKIDAENVLLKSRLAELQAEQSAAESRAAQAEQTEVMGSAMPVIRAPASSDLSEWTAWQWLLFGSILLLAFAAGGYMVDWEARRRHGGFRV